MICKFDYNPHKGIYIGFTDDWCSQPFFCIFFLDVFQCCIDYGQDFALILHQLKLLPHVSLELMFLEYVVVELIVVQVLHSIG